MDGDGTDGASKMDQYEAADAQYHPVEDQNALLKTIKVPHNLSNLSSRLPGANYQKMGR